MKKFLLFCGLLVLNTMVFSQQFSLQIINNSTSGAPEEILPLDVYINDSLYASAQTLSFQDATELITLPAGGNMRISIAYAPSNSVDQAFVIYNLNQFEANKAYVAVLDGAFGNSMNPFRLEVAGGLEEVSLEAGRYSIRPYNGLGTSESVRLLIQRSGQLVDPLRQGDFGRFWGLPVGPQIVELSIGEDRAHPYLFSIPLSEKDSISYTVLAAGIPDSLPDLTLYAVGTDGSVIFGQLFEPASLVINEVDYDQPGTDDYEFIELKNTGNATVALDNIQLELFNGSTWMVYDQIDLPAISLAPEEFYVVCFSESVKNCDLQVSGSIQNGGSSPDAILLSQDQVIIDAMSYEGTIPGITEGSSDSIADDDTENTSLSRVPDGQDTNQNDQDFQMVCSTPGAENLLNTSCEIPTNADSTFVQIIHDFEGVDLLNPYLGDINWGVMAYQTATAFVKVPAGVERKLSVLDGTGAFVSPYLDSTFVFQSDSVYTIVIEGTVLSDISVQVNALARVEASSPFAIDFNFYHGVPNGSELNVLIKRVGFAAKNLNPLDFSDYVSALPGIYLLDLYDTTTNEVIATFELDIRSFGGQPLTIVVSKEKGAAGELVLFSYNAEGERTTLPLVEFAQVQLIQNIPNIKVDVYIDDVLVFDNIDYRSASSFLQIRANKDLSLEVKGAESTPSDPPILAFDNVRFQALTSSLLVLGGDGTDDSPVDLFILKDALEMAVTPEEVSLGFFHGGTDVNPLSFLGEQFEPYAVEVEFGRFRDYQNFVENELILDVRETSTGRDLGFFGADLSSKKGQAGLVFSSGVVEDSQTFGLFIAFADGSVVPMYPLDYSRLQLVNNMPDSQHYDLYFNQNIWAENLSFRTATPFMNVRAGMVQDLVLVPTGIAIDSAVFVSSDLMFVKDSTYQIFLNGWSESPTFPIVASINDQAKEVTFQDFSLEVTAHHGSLATNPLEWAAQDGMPLVDQLAFGEFEKIPSLGPVNQLIRISEQGTNRRLGAFAATLDQVPPASPIVIFTSGLPGSDFGFGLFAVLPDGTVLSFSSVDFAKLQLVNALQQEIDVFINGELVAAQVGYREAIPFQTLRAGEVHEIVLLEPGLNCPQNPVCAGVRASITPVAEEVISTFLAGKIGEEALFFNRKAKDNAGGDNKFAFNFFQGSADENSLDLILQNFTTLYRNVDFGTFTEYTVIEPLSSDPLATFEVGRFGTSQILGTYDADFSPFDNQAMTLFSTGTADDDFALWAVLPDGMTFPLSVVTGTNDISQLAANVRIFPNPTPDILKVQFELLERADVRFQVLDLTGKIFLRKQTERLNAGKYQQELSLEKLPEGMYLLQLSANDRFINQKIVVQH